MKIKNDSALEINVRIWLEVVKRVPEGTFFISRKLPDANEINQSCC
jgi:hypothetical protein